MTGRVIATGNFDGCHLGHQEIFRRVQSVAQERGLQGTIITFEPHTRHLLHSPGVPLLLTPLAEKQKLMQQWGLNLEVLTFDAPMSALSPDAYIRDIIRAKLNAVVWIVGHDHHFGAQGAGQFGTKTSVGELDVVHVEPWMVHDQVVSSTKIRKFLEIGELESANAMLGRSYGIMGTVVHGDARGREIGFPTANLQPLPHKLLPAPGVYAGWVVGLQKELLAVANIGLRPTFGGEDLRFEVHIPDFSEDLYGKTLEMKLNLRLRGERRFSLVSELKDQLARDVARAKGLLGTH